MPFAHAGLHHDLCDLLFAGVNLHVQDPFWSACTVRGAPAARSDRSCSVHARAGQHAHLAASIDASQRRVIGRDDATAREVVAANAKLAAEALLRSLSKRVGPAAMRELEVVALAVDVESKGASLLRKGWYHNACYFFE